MGEARAERERAERERAPAHRAERAPAHPGGPAGTIAYLQRSAGNRAVGELVGRRTPVAVQRFASAEHAQIGHTAAGAAQKTSIRYGESPAEVLSFGEVVALSGDFFASLGEMETLAGTRAGREQIRYARWKALYQSAQPEPAVSEGAKTAVNNRYFGLAASNISHFSGGGTAGATYQDGHREALRRAFLAGLHGSDHEFQAAMAAEAASQHYLTDMFSGGHVRTPRASIRQWYQAHHANSPRQLQDLLVDRLVRNLNEIDHDQLQYIPDRFIRPRVVPIVENMAGPAIRAFSLGDIVSLTLHNLDNEQGVQVTSAVDAAGAPSSTPWTAYGDSSLNTPRAATTLAMVVAAARASIAELTRARQAGAAQRGAPSAGTQAGGLNEGNMADAETRQMEPFAALAYVPHATSANTPVSAQPSGPGDTASLAWQWGHFTETTRRAVDATVRGEIGGTVADVANRVGDANGVIVQDAGWPIGTLRLHAREAVQRIATELQERGLDVIIEAIGSDPGGAPPVPAEEPRDAGVPLPAGVP